MGKTHRPILDIISYSNSLNGYFHPNFYDFGCRQKSQIPADSAIFPSPDIPITSDSFGPSQNKNTATGSLYLDPTSKNIFKGPSSFNMVRRQLKFPTDEETSYHEDEPLNLPSIQEHLPAGTDIDAADALTALYRSHCISVIDCFRFCKEKMLWHHFTSFHGTLTVPVQKLLAHPNIAPWIKECDWLMYQKMIRFVAPLALQVVPIRVIDTFRAISTKLGPHISLTFQNHPPCVQDAKLGPATIFASLLDRLLRVNATAHAAANMLTNDANRDQMWHDWVVHVKPVRVVESSLPGCGYTRVLDILTSEIRNLLGPLRTTSYLGMNSAFTNVENNAPNATTHHAHPDLDDSSTEGVLDRWTNFLLTLPSRFPGADARLLLHCVGEVGSAALRDITMAQAVSFGSWWVTKVWVDEMLQWLAEKGGFMEHLPESMEMRGKAAFFPDVEFPMDEASETFAESRPRTAASQSVEAPSRLQSLDPCKTGYHRQHSVLSQNMQCTESSQVNHFMAEPNRRSHVTQRVSVANPPISDDNRSERTRGLCISHPQLHPQGLQYVSSNHLTTGDLAGEGMNQQHTHDDSGIGMGLEEDDELSLAKYGGFITGSVNGGSDPADVVVC
jgi:regulatory factor X, other